MPWFWKKSPHSVYLWVKISIQNVVSRLSRRKSFKSFPCEAFFLLKVLTKCLSKCPICPKPPLPWKISHYTPAFSGSFWTSLLNPNKNPIRNSFFDKWVSFDKCFFPINSVFNMSIWCSDRTTQREKIFFSVNFIAVRIYRYFLFVYMQKI